jgi:hypothetical protein
MRWFYLFVFIFLAWSGFVHVALRDDVPVWQSLDQVR